jgi:hypothetical protein
MALLLYCLLAFAGAKIGATPMTRVPGAAPAWQPSRRRTCRPVHATAEVLMLDTYAHRAHSSVLQYLRLEVRQHGSD